MSATPTPRTDAASLTLAGHGNAGWVYDSFARTLERETAVLQYEIDRLKLVLFRSPDAIKYAPNNLREIDLRRMYEIKAELDAANAAYDRVCDALVGANEAREKAERQWREDFGVRTALLKERDEAIAARETAERERERLKAVLRKWKQRTVQVDNGTCAVCGCGTRYCKSGGKDATKCSNPDCLSTIINAVLGEFK